LSIKCYFENLKPYDKKSTIFGSSSTNNSNDGIKDSDESKDGDIKWPKMTWELVKTWTESTQFKIKILNINTDKDSYGVDFINSYGDFLRNNPLTQSITYFYNIQSISLRETLVYNKLASFIKEEQESVFKRKNLYTNS
jgi:hypothetical protein